MSSDSNRSLSRALIVSLLAHVFLLQGVVRSLPVGPEALSTALTVVVRRPNTESFQPSAEKTVSRTETKRPASGMSTLRENPTRKVVVPEPLVVDKSASTATASIISQSAVAVTTPVAHGSPAASVVGGGGATDVSSPAAGSSALGQESVNAEDVRQFRTSLAINARRFKQYPPLARERGWEGSVEITLVFHRLQPGPEISLASSSGWKMLDDQALEMISQAARVTNVPERLRRRDFQVLLPVRYSLDNEP